jgi:hypothetical protein
MGAHAFHHFSTNEGRVTICAPADHAPTEYRFVFSSVYLTISTALVTLPDTARGFTDLHIAASINAFAIYK